MTMLFWMFPERSASYSSKPPHQSQETNADPLVSVRHVVKQYNRDGTLCCRGEHVLALDDVTFDACKGKSGILPSS